MTDILINKSSLRTRVNPISGHEASNSIGKTKRKRKRATSKPRKSSSQLTLVPWRENWSVRAIKGHRFNPDNGKLEFYISWYGDYPSSWEPFSHLHGCRQLIGRYLSRRLPVQDLIIFFASTGKRSALQSRLNYDNLSDTIAQMSENEIFEIYGNFIFVNGLRPTWLLHSAHKSKMSLLEVSSNSISLNSEESSLDSSNCDTDWSSFSSGTSESSETESMDGENIFYNEQNVHYKNAHNKENKENDSLANQQVRQQLSQVDCCSQYNSIKLRLTSNKKGQFVVKNAWVSGSSGEQLHNKENKIKKKKEKNKKDDLKLSIIKLENGVHVVKQGGKITKKTHQVNLSLKSVNKTSSDSSHDSKVQSLKVEFKSSVDTSSSPSASPSLMQNMSNLTRPSVIIERSTVPITNCFKYKSLLASEWDQQVKKGSQMDDIIDLSVPKTNDQCAQSRHCKSPPPYGADNRTDDKSPSSATLSHQDNLLSQHTNVVCEQCQKIDFEDNEEQKCSVVSESSAKQILTTYPPSSVPPVPQQQPLPINIIYQQPQLQPSGVIITMDGNIPQYIDYINSVNNYNSNFNYLTMNRTFGSRFFYRNPNEY